MPLLPLENPEGIQLGYGAATTALKNDASRGLYTVDAVNGTVYAAELMSGVSGFASRLDISLGAEGADTANEIRVSVQAQDAGENNLAETVVFRLSVLNLDMTAATNATIASVDTGTLLSTIGTGKAALASSTAAGLLEFDVLDASVETIYVVIEVMGNGGASSFEVVTFA